MNQKIEVFPTLPLRIGDAGHTLFDGQMPKPIASNLPRHMAKWIQTRVNAHEELLAALKKAHLAIDYDEHKNLYEVIESAIRKAEGK